MDIVRHRVKFLIVLIWLAAWVPAAGVAIADAGTSSGLEYVDDQPSFKTRFVPAATIRDTRVGMVRAYKAHVEEQRRREAARNAIPASIIACESGGSYTAENPTSTASGKYQIVDGTWDGFGGYTHASDAPPHIQDAKAAQLWDGGRGAHHWRQCL